MFALQDYLSGASSLMLHQGIGGVLFAAFLAGAWFVPLLRKYFVGAALIVLAFMIAEDIGIVDANKITAAKEKIVITKVDNAVAKSKTPAVMHKKDPWDRKEY
jgi:hypothetical protein